MIHDFTITKHVLFPKINHTTRFITTNALVFYSIASISLIQISASLSRMNHENEAIDDKHADNPPSHPRSGNLPPTEQVNHRKTPHQWRWPSIRKARKNLHLQD